MTHLNGSEKQVAWATDIRKEFIEKTKADMKSADKNDVLDMKAMLKVADNITEAADWISVHQSGQAGAGRGTRGVLDRRTLGHQRAFLILPELSQQENHDQWKRSLHETTGE